MHSSGFFYYLFIYLFIINFVNDRVTQKARPVNELPMHIHTYKITNYSTLHIATTIIFTKQNYQYLQITHTHTQKINIIHTDVKTSYNQKRKRHKAERNGLV